VSEFQADSAAPTRPGPFAPAQDDAPRPSPVVGPGAANGVGPALPGGQQRLAAVVKGRIEVADEVVEKVAALAAIEVEGVADLGGDFARALESVRERIGIGQKRGDQGVKARITGREVAVDVVIMVMYGHVVMDVARNVQTNVAIQTHRMLGLNVVEVNVTVDDVKLPAPAKPAPDAPPLPPLPEAYPAGYRAEGYTGEGYTGEGYPAEAHGHPGEPPG
jgi:uncharacterized alkaline shock family protein YloU